MNNFNYATIMGNATPTWVHVFGPTLIVIMLWSFLWKGLALWHAGRKGQVWWFIAMMFINTAGILEIVYLFLVLKLKLSNLFSKK